MNATKHLPDHGECSPTIAGGIKPEDLTPEEKELIKKGVLGYCEGHRLIYKKFALHECVVPSIFSDVDRKSCKEWPMDPDYTEVH